MMSHSDVEVAAPRVPRGVDYRDGGPDDHGAVGPGAVAPRHQLPKRLEPVPAAGRGVEVVFEVLWTYDWTAAGRWRETTTPTNPPPPKKNDSAKTHNFR